MEKQGLPPIIMFGGGKEIIIQICNVWHMNWKRIINLSIQKCFMTLRYSQFMNLIR